MKRLAFVIGMSLLVPLLFAQEAAGDGGLGDAEPEVSAVDETQLLIGEPSESAEPVAISPFTIWDLLRMIVVLGAVVGVVYLLFFLLKRAGKGRAANNGSIRVLSTQSLPGNRALYLVEVAGQVFLVGSGSESVSLISEITEKEALDTLLLTAPEGGAAKRSFGEMIASFVKGSGGESVNLLRDQQNRLRRLRQG